MTRAKVLAHAVRLLALVSDVLDGITTIVILAALFECGFAALILGTLAANTLRLLRGQPDVGMGSVGVGAGALALFVRPYFSEDRIALTRAALAFGLASIVVGLLNMVRGRSSRAS